MLWLLLPSPYSKIIIAIQTRCFSCRQSPSIIIFHIEVKKPDDCDSGIGHHFEIHVILGSLTKGVFEKCTSTGSEVLFILKQASMLPNLYSYVSLLFTLICSNIWAKPPSKTEKKPTSG